MRFFNCLNVSPAADENLVFVCDCFHSDQGVYLMRFYYLWAFTPIKIINWAPFQRAATLPVSWTGQEAPFISLTLKNCILKYFLSISLSGLCDNIIQDIIYTYLVLPNRITIPLVGEAQLAQLRFPVPKVTQAPSVGITGI